MIKMTEALFLTVIAALGQERSIYGAYHLLQGKKSAQTIQDGHLFSVLPYFGLLPDLKRDDVPKMVFELEKKGLLKRIGEEHVEVRDKGNELIAEYHQQRPYLNDLQGWYYHQQASTFWLRFTLYVQTLTHMQENHTRFFPITQNKRIQQWVKQNLPRTKQERAEELMTLYHECQQFLMQCKEEQAYLFTYQLSSVIRIGATLEQVAYKLKLPSDEAYLLHQACLHQLLKMIVDEKNTYPALAKFGADFAAFIPLTDSAKETLNYLKQGMTVEKIANIRKLKQATIEDHLVEVALYDRSFNIDYFVDVKTQKEIYRAAHHLHTRKLRDIKRQVREEVSYFMIRLTLTRGGVPDES
ncbi:helix-turn-helix domain-containing protein [Halalkalibacter urbisdiaboli]|uniref:helix-turn-helix domain-containing protein n=1 Tax=Halalkalibacter urbisdiaboli TaxID=1960589 RepID=UPI000B443727|nr:helix-turn-helix domain-containing protein [Halalkalibacter urbisdiaboli]